MSIAKRRYAVFAIILSLLAAWVMFFWFVDPETFVDYIGVRNTYAIAFLLAVFGGLSTPTGTSFFAAIAAFAAGGASPLLLSLTGGLGIFVSDSIFFLVARKGVDVLEARAAPASRWLRQKMEKWPTWAILLGVFLYMGLSPLPNDILMIALALAGFKYRTLAPVIFAGSISIVAITAFLGQGIFG